MGVSKTIARVDFFERQGRGGIIMGYLCHLKVKWMFLKYSIGDNQCTEVVGTR